MPVRTSVGKVSPESLSDPCAIDPDISTMVHRFDSVSRTCRCGKVVVEECVRRQGFPQRGKKQPKKD